MKQNVFGFTLGLLLGWAVTPVFAQSSVTARIDPMNAACWDQPDTSLAAANALKVRVTYDEQPAVAVLHECTGTTSPFACTLKTPVPMTVQQAAGVHRIFVEGARVDPLDGSLTAYAPLIDFRASFTAAPTPPLPGSNGRIVKIVLAIVAAMIGFWAWLV